MKRNSPSCPWCWGVSQAAVKKAQWCERCSGHRTVRIPAFYFILFCHVAKVLKVSPFEVCADLGMLCKKRLWNCCRWRLGRILKNACCGVGISLGCLDYPTNALGVGRNIGTFLSEPCLKFTRNLLKQTRWFCRIVLPHWNGVFLRKKKKSVLLEKFQLRSQEQVKSQVLKGSSVMCYLLS